MRRVRRVEVHLHLVDRHRHAHAAGVLDRGEAGRRVDELHDLAAVDDPAGLQVLGPDRHPAARLLAVRLPAGRHRVTLAYRGEGFVLGLAVSALTALAMLVLWRLGRL